MAEPNTNRGLLGTLKTFLENRGFYLEPSEVDKIEKPFEEILPTESTEFGDQRDLKDVDVVSASHYLSPFGMFQQKTSNQNEMVQQYRNVSMLSYVADAVDEISNESLVYDDQPDKMVFVAWNDKLNKISENMRTKVQEEFDKILELLNFEEDGHDYFKQWYVDGRLVFQIVLNKKKVSAGIQKIKLMSCMHLSRMFDPSEDRYFWIYDNKQMKDNQGRDVVGKIPDELMVYVPSGVYIKDQEEKLVAVSYLHTALRDINRLDTLEDHLLIYRLIRAPQRRVFYIDSGNLPPAKAEEYLKQVIASWRNKKTYDDVLGNVSVRAKTPSMLEDIFLLRRNGQGTQVETLGDGCLTLDTIIPLLDGRKLPLLDVIREYDSGKQNWIYSADPITGEVKPGKIDWAGVTKKNTQLIKITLDNGETIRCTPEHKFPVWGRGFVEGKDLTTNDSIIPFNTEERILHKAKGKRKYQWVYDNSKKEWVPTHRLVADSVKNTEYEQKFTYRLTEGKIDTVHHKDINRFNNNPENLAWMINKDHWLYHSEQSKEVWESLPSEEKRRRKKNSSEITKKFMDSLTEEEKKLHAEKTSIALRKHFDNLTEEERLENNERAIKNLEGANEKLQEKMKDTDFKKKFYDKQRIALKEALNTPEMYIKISEKVKNNWKKKSFREKMDVSFENQSVKCSDELFKIIIDTSKKYKKTELRQFLNDMNTNQKATSMFKQENSLTHPNFKGNFTGRNMRVIARNKGYEDWRQIVDESKLYNHRVISVEFLEIREDVGDLSIDNENIIHNYHTFAIGAGIFVKNSGLGDLNDLQYFRQRVFNALKVPFSRVNQEDAKALVNRLSPSGNEITAEEVKFHKFVNRLQAKFSVLFLKLLHRQLVYKNIIKPEEWSILKRRMKVVFRSDAMFSEAKRIKNLKDKFELLGNVQKFEGKYITRRQIFEEILGKSPEEIMELEREIEEEKTKYAGEKPAEGGGE